jgi:hypothetical protein
MIEVYEVKESGFTEDGLQIVEYQNGQEVDSLEEGIHHIFNEYAETEIRDRDTRWHMMVRDDDTNEYLLFDVAVSLNKEVCESQSLEEVQELLKARYAKEETSGTDQNVE